MAEHKYKLAYQVERRPEGMSKEQLETFEGRWDPKKTGACDAMLIASVLYPEDGSLSVLFIGHDGRTDTELADIEWWKVWTMLTRRLANSETLDPSRKEFCAEVFEFIARPMREAAQAAASAKPDGE